MARRSNRKTKAEEGQHPKLRDGDQERGHSFVAPDRPDQISLDGEDRPEVIDVMNRGAAVDVRGEQDGDDAPDRDGEHGERDSAREGDARDMASEDGDGDDGDGEQATVRRGGVPRRDAQGRRPARSQGGEEDDEHYSRRVRARINREIALRRERETQLTKERTANQELRDRLTKVERAQASVANDPTVKQLETEIAAIRTKLAKAIEDGTTLDQVRLQEELADKLGDLKLKKHTLEQERAAAEERHRRQEAEDKRIAEEEAAGGTRVGQDRSRDFMEANAHWWAQKAHSKARRECIELDKDILAEIKDGALDIEPYSEEHFEELAARLSTKFPDLDIVDPDGHEYEFEGDDDNDRDNDREETRLNNRNSRDTRSGGRRAPTGGNGVNRNGRRQQTAADLARAGKVRLDETDFSQMRLYGLDPNNPEHKKRFGKERMRTIITDERRGGGARQ